MIVYANKCIFFISVRIQQNLEICLTIIPKNEIYSHFVDFLEKS